jgi:hypothetical protein
LIVIAISKPPGMPIIPPFPKGGSGGIINFAHPGRVSQINDGLVPYCRTGPALRRNEKKKLDLTREDVMLYNRHGRKKEP